MKYEISSAEILIFWRGLDSKIILKQTQPFLYFCALLRTNSSLKLREAVVPLIPICPSICKIHYLGKSESGLIFFNDQAHVYNMSEASVYDYNATRRNIISTVKHSPYIP